jgi:hypothetical protein
MVDRLVVPPALLTEILDAARRRLLDGDWELAVVVTDLPCESMDGRSRHVSPTHGIGVLSVPALGALNLGPRVRRTLLQLVGDLVGGGDDQPSGDGWLARMRRRWERGVLSEFATEAAERPGGLRILFVPAVLFANLRLLLGMVRANRPWRLAARLYRVLVAAFAAGAHGVVISDIWRISAAMGWWRLAVTCVLSIAVTIVLIIVAHGLWERAHPTHASASRSRCSTSSPWRQSRSGSSRSTSPSLRRSPPAARC